MVSTLYARPNRALPPISVFIDRQSAAPLGGWRDYCENTHKQLCAGLNSCGDPQLECVSYEVVGTVSPIVRDRVLRVAADAYRNRAI